uniref:Reverse transcriptase Ty1/copia-type domain-containing protein n=1 Tax=Tanacetum cinerariifolium TaxID=118510 RepID=A0A6L2NB38_TANCI|nr:hypothetical protein [Tanacetum cinerariifolium]
MQDPENEDNEVLSTEKPRVNQEKDANVNSTNNINTISLTANVASTKNNDVDENIVYGCVDDPNMPNLEEIVYLDDVEDVGVEADMTTLDTNILVSPIPTTRIHKDHPVKQIIRDIHSAPQTKKMTKNVTNHSMFSSVQQRINHKDFHNCLFACFLSQVEPKKVIQALTDLNWIEAMQDELPQFKLQQVWIFVDLPYDKRAIKTKWIYRNKKDERGIVVINKARVHFSMARLKRRFISVNFLGLKIQSSLTEFIRGQIDKTLFIKRVKGDILLVQVYVDDIIFGSTIKEMCTEFEKMMHKSQDKYVNEILKKFGFLTVKTASTPMETSKPLMKDENAEDVDVHLYRSMIGSLMYLTSSSGLYTNDDWNKVKQLLRMKLKLTLAYTYYCMLKVNVVRHKLTTAIDVNVVEDVHNLDAFLSKPTESEGFEQIIDFLNANPIKYVLTVNPIIYTSYIEQFWATTTAKNINEEAKIQAKVDGNKVTISEATIRRDLKFEDGGGVDYLSNEVIFDSTHEHLDSGIKFLMYLRFVQVFLDKQVDGMSKHNAICVITSHTKKVFSNMKRVGKDFSRKHTPLFTTMIVQAQEELYEDTEVPTDTQHTPTIIQPTTSQPQTKQNPRKTRRKDTELPQTSVPTKVDADEAVYKEMYDSVERAATIFTGLDAKQDRDIISKTQFTATLNEPSSIGTSSCSGPRRQETMRDVTTQTRVLDLKKIKTAQAKEIANLKKRVKRLERKKKSRSHRLKRLYKVRLSASVESSTEEQSLDKEEASKQERNIVDIDADAQTTLVDETAEDQRREKALEANITEWDDVQAMMDADYELVASLQEEEQGELTIEEKSRLFMELMDKRKKHFAKLRAKEKTRKPPTKAQKRNQIEIRTEESSKRAGEDLQHESTKKQKVDDDQEAVELKMCLEIVLDDKDDVTIDATPLTSKSPTIIDYKIHKEGRKSYFQIIRADASGGSPPQAQHHHGAAVVAVVGSAATTEARNQEFHKFHRDGGGQSATHSPTTAVAAAGSCCCRCSAGGGVGGDEWWGYGGSGWRWWRVAAG